MAHGERLSFGRLPNAAAHLEEQRSKVLMGQVVEFIDPLDGCQSRQPVHPTDRAPATTRGQKQINQEYGRQWRILNTQQNARGLVEYWRDPIVSCFMNHQLAQCPRHAHGHVAEGGVLWLSDGMPRQNAAQ